MTSQIAHIRPETKPCYTCKHSSHPSAEFCTILKMITVKLARENGGFCGVNGSLYQKNPESMI